MFERSVFRAERGPVALAAAAVCALEVADALASNCADALYLARRGAAGLGVQLAASSALLALTLGLVGGLADRGGRARLLGRLAVVAAVLLGAARVALAVAPALAPVGLIVLTKQVSAALELGFWVVIADRFDARQARRLVPLILAAGGVGLVGGSLATQAVVGLVGVENLLLCSAGACVVAGVLARGLGAGDGLRPARAPLRDGGAATRRSELARRLVWVIAAAGAFGPVLYTALGAQAAASFGNEADLAGFYGRFRGVTNLLTLLAQTLLAPGLLRVLGIGAALLVAPAAGVLAGVALAARTDSLVAAVAQASARLADAAVETPAEKLAQNLLPRDVRGRIAGFLDGVAKRGGALVGGLLTWIVAAPSLLGLLAAVVAGLWLTAALALRRRFPFLAVEGLAAARKGGEAAAYDRATDRALAAQLAGPDDARRELAIEVVTRGAPAWAAALLVAAARARPAARGRLVLALDRVLEADFPAPPGLDADLHDLLRAARAPLERAMLVQAIGRLGDPAALARLLDEDEPPAVRLAAACARGDADAGALLTAALSKESAALALIRGAPPDPALRAIAIEELRARPALNAHLLAEVARFGSPPERVLALEKLPRGAPMFTAAADALEDPDPTLRAAALRALGALGEPRLAERFARALADRADEVRDAAAAALVRLGAPALPVLLVAARFGGRAARHAALEALRDLETEPGAHDDLVEAELAELWAAALRRHALADLGSTAAGRLFLDRLEERRAEIARTLLLVVEVRLGAAIGRVAGSLGLNRPRALEALDALLPRGLARRVLPALDDAPLDGHPDLPAADEALRAELAGPDPLARVLLVRALDAAGRTQLREVIRVAAQAATDDLDPRRLLARVHSDEEDPDVPRSVDTMVFLREIALFADLTPSQLADLAAACAWETVDAGERIEPDGLIVTGDRQIVGIGTLFGDPAAPPFTLPGPGRILRLSRPAFERAVEDTPGIAIAICRALHRRNLP